MIHCLLNCTRGCFLVLATIANTMTRQPKHNRYHLHDFSLIVSAQILLAHAAPREKTQKVADTFEKAVKPLKVCHSLSVTRGRVRGVR